MSRVIFNDHLFTPDEVKYLQDRNENKLIEENRKEFGPGGPREHDQYREEDDDEPLLDEDIYDYVASLDIPHLKAEVIKAGKATDVDEREMRFSLAIYLQDERDGNRNKR